MLFITLRLREILHLDYMYVVMYLLRLDDMNVSHLDDFGWCISVHTFSDGMKQVK